MLAHITKRRIIGNSFSQAVQIIVTSHFQESYLIKFAFSISDADGVCVQVMPGRRRYKANEFNLANVDLPQCSCWTKKKIKDLQYLTQFVTPAQKCQCWENLVQYQQVLLTRGAEESDSDRSADDPEDILLDYMNVKSPAP